MKQITFYFDVISPYAYLAFEKLPEALQGISHEVIYKPVLFAGMLKHFGQLGPAEIAPKREWTYRQVAWLAKQSCVPLQTPVSHPFNPLPLLRLALAAGKDGACNRFVAEKIFRHAWCSGLDAGSMERALQLHTELKVERSIDDPVVKAQLLSNTQEAIGHEIFGVPTCRIDHQNFWGLDALPVLRDYLLGDAWFEAPAWTAAKMLPYGQTRNQNQGNSK